MSVLPYFRGWIIFHCTAVPQFVYLFTVGGHSVCFQFLAIVIVQLRTHVHEYLSLCFQFFSVSTWVSESLGRMGILFRAESGLGYLLNPGVSFASLVYSRECKVKRFRSDGPLILPWLAIGQEATTSMTKGQDRNHPNTCRTVMSHHVGFFLQTAFSLSSKNNPKNNPKPACLLLSNSELILYSTSIPVMDIGGQDRHWIEPPTLVFPTVTPEENF